MLKLVINGARGRMGRLLETLADADERFRVTARLGRADDDVATRLAPADLDVIVDFSTDAGARRAAQLAARTGRALLVGTTALSPETLDEIGDSARSAPVMVAPNTSRGIAVMNHLVAEAARRLGPDFSIDVIEYHHAGKRDAPSGTALKLAESMRESGRADVPPTRLHSVRAGDIPGEHEVHFSGPGERLKIFHLVAGREVFARGALAAAAWLATRPPGTYRIEESMA